MIACKNAYHLVEVKRHEKNSGAQIWAEIGPKIRFFVIFSSLVFISFSLNCIGW